MATTGLEVFDRTLHTTNLWLDEINAEIGPDRHLAWHVLSAVLRCLRDEMQVEQSAHFAAQLPLLVRGAYFDQYRPAQQPASIRTHDEFIARIQRDLDGSRPVKAELAATAVMRTLNRHVTEGQIRKVRDALPKGVRAMWPEPGHAGAGHGKPDQGTRLAGQQAPGGQRTPPQQPSAAQASAPQQAGPLRPAPQNPQPQRTAAQTPQHPAPHSPAREWDEIEEAEGEKTPVGARSSSPSSGKSAHVPIGVAGRPAGVHAAPAGDRGETIRKATRTHTKGKDR